MVIDIDKLDKRRTYVCLEYGTSNISKAIMTLTKIYCKKSDKVPSHIFMLVYEDKTWNVYESHMVGIPEKDIPSGVRKYSIDKLDSKVLERSDCYPVKVFSRKLLKKYLGTPYGTRDITAMMRARILHREGKQSDKPGLVCSEYAACCYKPIQNFFKLPSWNITPAHWLEYFLSTY